MSLFMSYQIHPLTSFSQPHSLLSRLRPIILLQVQYNLVDFLNTIRFLHNHTLKNIPYCLLAAIVLLAVHFKGLFSRHPSLHCCGHERKVVQFSYIDIFNQSQRQGSLWLCNSVDWIGSQSMSANIGNRDNAHNYPSCHLRSNVGIFQDNSKINGVGDGNLAICEHNCTQTIHGASNSSMGKMMFYNNTAWITLKTTILLANLNLN